MTMGKESTATASIVLPEDDHSIEHAFSEADAKLSAWSAAMREAEHQLLAHPSLSRTASPTPNECPGDSIGPPAPESDEIIEPETVEPEAVAPVEEDPVSVAAPSETPPDEAGQAEAMVLEPLVTPSSDEPEPDQVSEQDEEAEARRREDEELFASLDEETAHAIHVMRRLSAGEKSVRELLEQYEESKQAGTADPASSKKRSWFSRGR